MKWIGICSAVLIGMMLSGRTLSDQLSQLDIKGGIEQYEQNIADRIAEGTEWNLILVNRWNPLPEDFEVELARLDSGHMVDARIIENLEDMLDAANKERLYPVICSSYRTNEKQEYLYQNRIYRFQAQGYSAEEAKTEAAKWVAVPGTSEHQAGLALDIVSSSYQGLDQKQEETAEQKWLMENSWRYGFILRYPEEKKEITGINYEPWHYRYVGKKAAREIYKQGICLEEYLEQFNETYKSENIIW